MRHGTILLFRDLDKVSHTWKTTDLLRKTGFIVETTKIANLCDGRRTPLQISRDLELKYEEVQLGLEKLNDLDIIEEKTE